MRFSFFTGHYCPYLVNAPDLFLDKRRQPICPAAPAMAFGSMPNDGGHLLLSQSEKDELLETESNARPYIRPLMGSEEFIKGKNRWCLWLQDLEPAALKKLPFVLQRVAAVKAARAASARPTTQALANMPTLFGEIRQPRNQYLAVPEVSSETRLFIPIGFLASGVIATNKLYTIDGASLFHFGILQSSMHMAWTRSVCGRLKSDFQYSAGVVYQAAEKVPLRLSRVNFGGCSDMD